MKVKRKKKIMSMKMKISLCLKKINKMKKKNFAVFLDKR
jgi:hypothetical protein